MFIWSMLFSSSAVFRLAVSQPSSNPVFGQRADRLCARRLSLQRDQLQRAQRWKHDPQPHGYYNSLSNTIQSYNFPDCFVPQSTLLWTLARAARTTTRSHESHPCCQVLNPFTFQVWLLHKSDFLKIANTQEVVCQNWNICTLNAMQCALWQFFFQCPHIMIFCNNSFF